MYGKASSTVKIAFRRPIGLPQKAFQFDIAFGLLKIKQKKNYYVCFIEQMTFYACFLFLSTQSRLKFHILIIKKFFLL